MTLADLLLAAALLGGAGPIDLNDSPALRERFPTLRAALTVIALDWEVLDPRETRYVLARPEDLHSDVAMLRRRVVELSDAPPLSDALRFPDKAYINELLSFNRAYRNEMDARAPLETVYLSELRTVQREIDELYAIWDTVRDARCSYYYVTVRRQALKRLKEQLGNEAYERGDLPPAVPIWRFQWIR